MRIKNKFKITLKMLVFFICSTHLFFSNLSHSESLNPNSNSPASINWWEKIDLSKYNYVDPSNIIPINLKTKLLAYFEMYKNQIANQEFISVIDMNQRSDQKRFYVIDIKSGKVIAFLVAHGKGSDKNHDGIAEIFSNSNKSLATSLGFYSTGLIYKGKNGLSLTLKGLEATNSNAEKRSIVIHGANYVSDKLALVSKKIGRSFGCPAVDMRYRNWIIDKLKNGSILLITK